jgi:hypothetical protein
MNQNIKIALIFICVVALGVTVLAFQKSPVEVKETQLEEYNHEEIIHLEEEYHTNNETHKDQLADFCSQRGSVAHLIEKIKVKDDTSEMVFVTCIDNEWINQWNPGDQGVLHFYLLNFANSNYDIVWQNKSNSDELNLRSVYSPEIIDIDEDGTEEIVLKGSNWGGTCTGFSDYTYVYSLNHNDIFSVITGKLADHDCNFVPVEPQFSENLNSGDLLKIRNYLENIIN